MISIYTDGAARGNPGSGGYGKLLLYQGNKKEISGMELMAVIIGLESLKKEKETVTIYSDSKYVVDSIAKRWVFGWEKKGFLNKKNPDLWKRFLVVYRKHTVHIEWVKGHADNEWNNRCDELATAAADKPDLLADEGYEYIKTKQELFD